MSKITLEPEDIVQTQENALELFSSGIKSQETRSAYERNLKAFLVGACAKLLKGDMKQRAQEFVNLARKDQDSASRIILAYVRELRKRTVLDKTNPDYLNPSTIPNKVKPIKKLLEMNNISVAWKRIHTSYPELDNIHKGRGYTREEIKLMLEHSESLAIDFVILTQSSAAIRVGSWKDLTWESVFPVYKVNGKYNLELEKGEQGQIVCGGITIYKGSTQEYETLFSIEAWEKLQEYKKEWIRKVKRQPTAKDPLILSRFKNPIPLSDKAIRTQITKIRERAGIVSPLTEGNRRHEVPVTHGFRRYWDKVMMEIGMKGDKLASLVKKERLMGHSGLVKTDKNYYWILLLECVPMYLQAMPNLMISDEQRLQHKLEQEKLHSDMLQQANMQKDQALEQLKELEVKVRRMEKYYS